MKTLLPILKTKLFLLGFVSACTVILATTVPQIRNVIAPKASEEKIVEQKEKSFSPKKKKNKNSIENRFGTPADASTTATVVSDKPDYAPLSAAIFTGDGFGANEEVVLKVKNLTQPCNTVSADSSYFPWTVTTDANGHFETNWTVCNCPGDSLRLRAVGQTSHDTAYAYFTDSQEEPHKIIINSINNNATSFCGSSALTMTFCADGVYAPKTGTTGLINTFRLRVTNPGGGSFDNNAAQDLVISSITQTSQVGSITCYTLTSNFPSIGTGSNNYRIRIDAWNPATVGDEYSYGGETLFEIIAPPTAEAGSNTTTCYGTLVNITAGSSKTNSTATAWTSNGDGVFGSANSLTDATYTPGANDIIAGSVTITLTAAGNAPCGPATDTKTLTIIKTPAPVVGPQFFCAGSPTVASLLNGGGLYNWYLELTGGSALTSNTSISTRSYFVSTTANGCESPRTEVSVTITANASAGTVSPGTTPQCVGSNTTYTVSGQELGGGTGEWSSSDAAIATVNASTGSVTAVSPGTVNIIYTVTGGCGGTKTAQASYTVYPAAPVLTAPANVCNTMFSLPSVTPVSGYDVQYSIDGDGWAANPSVTTPGCHTVKARYVLTGTSTAGPAGCNESNTVSVVIFPAKPSAPVVSNTCNAALTIPALVDVTGFTRQYSFNGGSTWGTSNTSSATPGCYTMKTKYVLTGACGTNNAAGIDAPCGTSDAGNAVIFPAAPIVAPLNNTCNTALASITAVTPVAGFTAEYAVKTPSGGGIYGAFGTLAAANLSLTNTPGCWSVKARYKLTDACGGTAANATSTDACGESTEVNAVVFPAPPLITASANTCNAAFGLPTVTPVGGFGVEFMINYSGWSATPTVPTTPGCYTIHAKYVLSQTCGSTIAGSDGPLPPCDDEEEDCPPVIGGCTVSLPVNVVIFPAAPSAPVVSNTCNAALIIPALNAVTGFTAQYSFDNGTNWGVSNTSASTTSGCYNMKTRYVLTNPCGTNGANTTAPAACAASATGNAVIFPAAPSAPVVTNTCNAALTIPELGVVTGFTAQYSFDNGTNWGVSNTSASTTPGCYNMKTRYVLTNACGTNIAGTSAPAACAASATGNAVIFPAKPSAPVVSNTCNAALTIQALTDVTGFTRQYSFDNGSTWGASNTSPNTPGCYTLKSKYILTSACGTINAGIDAPCGASDAGTSVIFPAKPSAPVVSNTCNAALTIQALTDVTGFTRQYSFDNGTTWGTSNTSPTTPGCYTMKSKYVLTGTCGTNNAAGIDAPCGASDAGNAVIFPARPSAPVVSNTCNAALTIPALTDVAGFTRQYSFDNGSTWGTSNTSPTTPGCYTMKSKYVLTGTCGTNNAAGIDAPCGASDAGNAVIFPAKPSAPVVSNTCNAALTIPALVDVTGFTRQYSFNGGSTWGTSNTSSTTPGCYTMKTRYVLSGTCGGNAANTEAPCGASDAGNAVIFPAAPIVAPLNNTCNTALASITAVTPVAGFTAVYAVKTPSTGIYGAFGTLAAANLSLTNTPGCWSVKARYKLTDACGGTAANETGTGACGESTEVNAVVFPAAPLITAPANTCYAAFSLPTVTPVVGFGVEYIINYTSWSATPTVPTTPGCYTVLARYVLSQACGSTPAGSDGPLPPCDDEEEDCPPVIGGCTVSQPVNVVIFPAAPSAPVVTNTCNAALSIPALSVVSGFTAQYSFDNGTNWGVSNTSASTTPGCYNMKTRYVLASPCGSNIAGAPAACAASATGNAVIFPAKPSAPVVTNTCNAALTIPALTDVTGFTRKYSFDDGASWSTSNVSSSTTPGCYTMKTKYVLTALCGTNNAAGIDAPCGTSNAANAVIFPAALPAPTVNGTCGPIVVTAPAPVTGFTIEYSFTDGASWTVNSPPTADNCNGYKIRTRYVTESACGTIAAGTCAPATCAMSPATTRKVDNTAPSLTGTAYTGTTLTNACKANAETAAPFNATNAKLGYSDVCSGTTVTAIKTGCTVTGNDCSWTATYTFKVVDECGNEFAGQTYSNTGGDKTPPTAICKNISVALGTGGSVSIVAGDVNNGSNDVCDANVSLALDKYTFTDAEVGSTCSKAFTVILTATDDCGNTATCSSTVTVGKRTTKLVYSGDASGQYSDPVNVKATLYDITGGEPGVILAGKTVKFTIGSQNVTAATDGNGIASTTITLNQNPATAVTVASCFVADGTYCGSTDSDAFDITPEKACGSYNGTLFVNTISTTTTSAIVRFQVVVTADADGSLGILNGTTCSVDFLYTDAAGGNATTVTALYDAANSTSTQAVFYKEVVISLGNALCKTFDVTWTIGGYYSNAVGCTEQQTQVTVAVPADDFSTGGGYIILTANSGGSNAGSLGTKNNWGYNVKWNKSLTNLQGNFNTIIRRNGRTYHVKSNKPTFLKISLIAAATPTTPARRKAEITYGNATLKDVTDIVNGVCTAPGGVCWGDGNGTIYLTVEDNGEPGSTGSIFDKIGFAVKDKNNSLWYSTNTWTNSTSTILLQNIDGGNIQIRQAGSAGSVSNQTVSTDITTDITPSVLPFDVKVFPNPSQHVFSLVLENATNEKVQIVVYDALGRQVKMFEKQSGNIPIHFGMDLKVGVYVVEVRQGDNRKTLKLVKQ